MDMHDGFSEFYASSYGAVLAAALVASVGDQMLAEDATADAFTKAYSNWDRVSEMQSPIGWTCRIAINRCKSRIRRVVRLRERLSANRPSVSYQDDAGLDGAMSVLEGLTERQRQVLLLRFVEDLSARETAQRLGVAEGTVGATIHQTRARLQSARKIEELS